RVAPRVLARHPRGGLPRPRPRGEVLGARGGQGPLPGVPRALDAAARASAGQERSGAGDERGGVLHPALRAHPRVPGLPPRGPLSPARAPAEGVGGRARNRALPGAPRPAAGPGRPVRRRGARPRAAHAWRSPAPDDPGRSRRSEEGRMRRTLLLLLPTAAFAVGCGGEDRQAFHERFLRVIAAEDARPGPGDPMRDSLVALAEAEHPFVRAAAVRALGRLRDPALVDAIARHLDDADPGVRAEAAHALARAAREGPSGP